jgi:hypothetical protein
LPILKEYFRPPPLDVRRTARGAGRHAPDVDHLAHTGKGLYPSPYPFPFTLSSLLSLSSSNANQKKLTRLLRIIFGFFSRGNGTLCEATGR